jgi:hypothetical protein
MCILGNGITELFMKSCFGNQLETVKRLETLYGFALNIFLNVYKLDQQHKGSHTVNGRICKRNIYLQKFAIIVSIYLCRVA